MSTSSPQHSGASGGGNALTPSEGSAFGDGISGNSSRMNISFWKDLTERKTTKDGLPQKRRGPKPDARPAVTRRQQLNRQAQRSHRERKEMHMHELELQVIYDKHLCRELTNENNDLKDSNRALEAENRLLKQVLDSHGIAYPNQNEPVESIVAPDEGLGFADETQISAPPSAISQFSLAETNQNSFHDSALLLDPSFNFADDTNPFPTPLHESSPIVVPEETSFSPSIKCDLQMVQKEVSVDLVNVSLSFVLKLEETCKGHASQIRVPGKFNPKATLNGHTLMASWGSEEDRAASAQHLKILLDMSQKLELEEELTPIMAWSYISKHERFTELTYTDFDLLGEELIAKTRCFGFGAALELFEVQDALNRIFEMKAPRS